MEKSFLREVLNWMKEQDSIEVAVFFNEVPVKAKLKVLDIDYERKQIIWSFNEKLRIPLLDNRVIYFKYRNDIFIATVIIHDDKEMVTSFPTLALEPKLNRRYVRVTTSPENPAFLIIDGKKYPIEDISEAGIGIILPSDIGLKEGEEKEMELELKGTVFDIKGKIVYIKDQGNNLIRVGIKLLDIPNRVRNQIVKYVFERQRDIAKKITMF
ncbi:MAG TPA: PilZ domain-containing protein [Persephonella sp.]|uniref:Type IV pilus assembly protein PilZ n=1 Tax=Persephonella marina (strain DSM 14350 / EX-H1) TaxID=123214 RepID=C0QTM0_PERMH|nr:MULTISPECIES: PilZ domain-containing protein [Persephonella]ACO03038.1 type IV pilus assembly protein PilZ [Persephonella marina EX-H1]HCB70349.1 PilZ domain-containing protein [Persephonella sp.]